MLWSVHLRSDWSDQWTTSVRCQLKSKIRNTNQPNRTSPPIGHRDSPPAERTRFDQQLQTVSDTKADGCFRYSEQIKDWSDWSVRAPTNKNSQPSHSFIILPYLNFSFWILPLHTWDQQRSPDHQPQSSGDLLRARSGGQNASCSDVVPIFRRSGQSWNLRSDLWRLRKVKNRFSASNQLLSICEFGSGIWTGPSECAGLILLEASWRITICVYVSLTSWKQLTGWKSGTNQTDLETFTLKTISCCWWRRWSYRIAMGRATSNCLW